MTSKSKTRAFIAKYLGWRNWSVLIYNSIFENIFIVFYIALSQKIVVIDFFTDLFCFICFSVFSTTYGYLVNDLADIDLDAYHGKDNTFMGDSKGKGAWIVALFGLLSMAFALRFISNPSFVVLWLIWILATTFYSLKPLRLKEKGKIGLAVVVLAQRVLPILLLFAAFRYIAWSEIAIFTVYVLFRGLSSDLNHQISDYRNDALTQTKTFAVDAGLVRTEKLFRFSLEIEKAFLLFSLLVMSLNASIPLQLYGISLMLLPLMLGMVLVAMAWYQTISHNIRINPFEVGRKDLFQFIHHGFPSVVLSLFFLILLMVRDWEFVLIVIALGLYQKIYSPDVIVNSFPYRAFRRIKTKLR